MALLLPAWQSALMSDKSPMSPPSSPPPPSPRAPSGGGCLIAAGLLIGPVIGLLVGEVSLGLIAGGVIGVVAALGLALFERNRPS
jgi:uncharacterized membrane protein